MNLSKAEREAKLWDFAQLLLEWIERYVYLGVPRDDLLRQIRTVLENLEPQRDAEANKQGGIE